MDGGSLLRTKGKEMDKLYGLTEKGAEDVEAFLTSKVHLGCVKLQRYLK